MTKATIRQRFMAALPVPVATGMRDVWGRVRRTILWRLQNPEHVLSSGLVIRITSPSDWFVYNEVFVQGEYDSAITTILDRAGPPPLILDLGANAGFFTLRLMDRWFALRGRDAAAPRVVAVEGSPATFRTLARNLTQPLLAEHCSPVCGLAGQRTGSALISTSANSGINSIVTRTSLFRRRARFVDLTRLLPPAERIALVKCDIEGAEEMLLDNYPDLLQRVDAVVMELHPHACNTQRCRQLLAAAGLTRHAVVRPYGTLPASAEWFSR
jgi:FkbM family methyltransferase